MRAERWLSCVGCVVCVAGSLTLFEVVRAQAPAAQAPAAGTAREWRYYGADLTNSKYSPLDQITKENFGRLKMAWQWESADKVLSKTMPGGGEWWAPSRQIFDLLNKENPKRWRDGQAPILANLKATPLMIGGVLYLNTPTSVAAAIDAKTGETLWIYNPKSYEAGTTTMSARWNQRGVAYWSDGTEQRVFWGTGDGYLLSVDARTGQLAPNFGEEGRVDLMRGLPHATRGSRDWLNALTYSVQSPPIVIKNTVITPASISSYNVNKEQIPGFIRGWDAKTGKLKWEFRTVPRPGEFGHESWGEGSWEATGKVTVWSLMSADEELGYVYLPMNTAAPDYYGGHRPGNNLFAESLVCLDVETGKRVWHFQMVHHGLWDYDLPAAPNLLDITVDGKRIKAVAQISKQGFVYTFDRVTGQPVWPIEERPVPPSTIPGEQASKTQPFPTKPKAFEYQGVTLDDLADFTPELRELARKAVSRYTIGPLFTPPTVAVPGGNMGTLQRPSASGGGNWSGAAVDPETGYLYVPSRNAASVNSLRLPNEKESGNLRYVEARSPGPALPQGLPLFKPPYSRMTAIDMNRGEHAWMTPLGNGNATRNHPMLKALNLPPLGGDSTLSGPLLTKTVLVMALTAGGTNDGPRLVAYDKQTGGEIASVDLPGAPIGTPMTYLWDSKQYISLTVMGQRGAVPRVVAYALP